MDKAVQLALELPPLIEKLVDPNVSGAEKLTRYGQAIVDVYTKLKDAAAEHTDLVNGTKQLNASLQEKEAELKGKIDGYGEPTKENLEAK